MKTRICSSLFVFLLLLHLTGSVGSAIQDESPSDARAHRLALTSSEWADELTCKQDQRLSNGSLTQLWAALLADCEPDELSWRYKYADELKPPFNHLIKDKTIDERLANILYTVALHSMFDNSLFSFNSGDPVEDARNALNVAGPSVDDATCLGELSIMSHLLDELQDKLTQLRNTSGLSLEERHVRLARVLDSYGRYESASLNGKIFIAGSYQECIGSQLTGAAPGRKFPMRFCWANLNFNKHLSGPLQKRDKFGHETARQHLYVGACLPRSCHSKSFLQPETRAIAQKLVNSQMQLPDSIYVDRNLEMDSVFCLVDSDSQHGGLSTSGSLCLLVLGLWISLCLLATVASVRRRHRDPVEESASSQVTKRSKRRQFWPRLLSCVDLLESWRDFTSDKRNLSAQAVVDLDVLNPVKLICCLFCIISHTALVFGSFSAGAAQIAAYVDTTPLLMAAILTSTVVDTFFVISGMLVVYISLQKLSRHRAKHEAGPTAETLLQVTSSSSNKPAAPGRSGGWLPPIQTFVIQWGVLASSRYLRIVPLYALLFWFRRDVVSSLGLGPMWDYGLNRETAAGACVREPWYTPFTFATAYKPMSKQCFLPSWSISNDIFFALFLSPLVLLYHRRPRLANAATILLILASTFAAIEALLSSFPPSSRQLLNLQIQGIVLFFTDLSHLYTRPLYRACATLIGFLAGYHLFKFEQRHHLRHQVSQGEDRDGQKLATLSWPAWLAGPTTQASFLYLIVHAALALVVNDFKGYIAPYHRLFTFYLVNIDRVVWSMANAVLFLQMTTTWRRNALMRNFSTQKWRTLAKLNFAMLFVHWIVIILYTGSMSESPTFSLWHIFAAFSFILLVASFLATAVHVVFENPFDKILKTMVFASQ